MRKMISLIVVMSFFMTSCAVRPVNNIAFKDRPLFATIPQTKDYVELGRVTAPINGFIWESCESLADDGLNLLIQHSKNMGGNTVIGVQISECQTQYGWFALYILPGLGPWVRGVKVEGIAVDRKPLPVIIENK